MTVSDAGSPVSGGETGARRPPEPSRVHTSCILCTVPRSGSWLLADYLDQTFRVGRLKEYFRPDHFRWYTTWKLPRTAPYGRYVLAAVTNTSTPNGVFGAKLHWYQLEWLTDRLRSLPTVDPSLSEVELLETFLPSPRYVHLHRNDTVRQAISWLRATYTDLWFERLDAPQRSLHRPLQEPAVPNWSHVKYLEEQLIRQESNWAQFFESGPTVPLEVTYEQLIESPHDTVRSILEFVGVEVPRNLPAPITRLKRLADDRTERLVESYVKVRDSIESEPFSLDEERAKVELRRFSSLLRDETS